MRSNVTIAGHPVHPMLVAFPIAFYTATAVCFIVYQANQDPFWFRMGFSANIAGVVMAIVAAIPGVIDWATAIPAYNPAKRTGTIHMSLNVVALLFFAANIWAQYGKWNDTQPVANAAVFLSLVGLICTVAAGWFGWKLVQSHHVGVEMSVEQERLEPVTPQAFTRPGRAS